MIKRFAITAIALTTVCSAPAFALGKWRVGPGPAVIIGLDDIATLYETNYNSTHTSTVASVEVLLPIGLSVQGTYLWDSGVRLDLGVGPFMMMRTKSNSSVNASLDHTEVAASGTVGYTFMRNATVSPYVRGGLVIHYASGTYAKSSDPGLLAAVGIEFARKSFVSYALEVAVDKSQVEFDRYRRSTSTVVHDTVKLNTFGTVISFLVKF